MISRITARCAAAGRRCGLKWGMAQAINAGDVMFTLAFLAIQDLAKTFRRKMYC